MTKENHQTDKRPKSHQPNEKTAEAIQELEKGLGNKVDSVGELFNVTGAYVMEGSGDKQ